MYIHTRNVSPSRYQCAWAVIVLQTNSIVGKTFEKQLIRFVQYARINSRTSYRVIKHTRRRRLEPKSFRRKQTRKDSKNNLARVVEGSRATLVWCCAGVTCRNRVKLCPTLGCRQLKVLRKWRVSSRWCTKFCPALRMQRSSCLSLALNVNASK